ncbi:unnamed protein product [Sordaria macrospora k-hell]|uniref:WGS project CABT00000000 data, contig 2.10 n=1 Tax=Sordaria macrospora (strain ATCC MYA-333 / DSM 997 / K(L3346) / K-hell) TaxID=771870 RepID=F7VWH1_SORMK|nr:uncharacterized protein SMAC_12718 [Sordaria macrospora k-hell]CCC09739.1 unnamed protein product [Sordaria macrospora k-hell]
MAAVAAHTEPNFPFPKIDGGKNRSPTWLMGKET